MNVRRHSLVSLFALLFSLEGCAPSRPAPTGVRVVSLAPNLTEIVCAVGGEAMLVGRSSACNYPPEVVARVPVVGDFGVPSMERILSVKPTLLLEVDLADEAFARQIDRLGISRVKIACRGISDIPGAIREIGQALGRQEQAERMADGMTVSLDRLRTESLALTNRPTVFVEIWGDPLTTVGKGSFVSDLVGLAGGRNLGDESSREYYQVSPEWVVSRDPDVILCLYMSDQAEDVRGQVKARPGWAGVQAVRAGRVHSGLNNDLLLRPGPRVLDGIRELRAAICAPGQTL